MSVAVVHVDYSIPVLWVQYIAVYKKELEAPSSSNKKMQLEGAVQNWEGRMKRNRKEKIERALYREKKPSKDSSLLVQVSVHLFTCH